MYVPDHFLLADRARILEIMRRHDFALLVTAPAGRPSASHLPFLLDSEAGEQGMLLAHMARANPQWRDFERLEEEDGEALVIFQGPHAYISPSWYGAGPAVPTWNYTAVHAYGRPRVVETPERIRAILERLVDTQEAGLAAPWRLDRLAESYVSGMMRGIVAFELPITRLHAKAKLNQNKSPADAASAAAALEASGEPMAREVAALMRALRGDA